MVETIMAFNMEEMGISLIIDDGESYPSYRISVERMSAFLNCVMEDIEEEIVFFYVDVVLNKFLKVNDRI